MPQCVWQHFSARPSKTCRLKTCFQDLELLNVSLEVFSKPFSMPNKLAMSSLGQNRKDVPLGYLWEDMGRGKLEWTSVLSIYETSHRFSINNSHYTLKVWQKIYSVSYKMLRFNHKNWIPIDNIAELDFLWYILQWKSTNS